MTELDPEWMAKRERMNELDSEETDEETREELLNFLALFIVALDFAERCFIEVGDEFTLSIDASPVAEDIARSMEKRGILKIKGDSIKWKA